MTGRVARVRFAAFMPAEIESYHDTPAGRAELAAFLSRSFRHVGGGGGEHWQRRFRHWWDENPFASAHPCRGWVLREGDQLAGYLGVIPSLYEYGSDARVPALAATSFAIDEGHRHAALAMAAQYQKLGDECLLVDTTPSPQVRAMLKRAQWTEQGKVRRKFLIPRLVRRKVCSGAHHLTTDPGSVTGIVPAAMPRPIQKHVTVDYLRWYCASPVRRHEFIGWVDEEGRLSSCLILTPRSIRGFPCWSVEDWFTSREDSSELHLLVGAQRRLLLSVPDFPGQTCWQGLPVVLEREEEICHFHRLPPQLHGLPRRSVLAEGDLGL
jgi:hypothetical protein